MEVSGLEEARKATGGERAGSSPLDNRKNNRGGGGNFPKKVLLGFAFF